MPIEYESAAPIALAANIYRNTPNPAVQQQLAEMLHSVTPGAGGGGRGGGGGYDDGGLQAAIFARDNQSFQRDEASLNRQAQAQGQQFQAGAQLQQQRERFQLQAQLSQVELSQQEKMRLQRMKNAVGDVMNDPSLSTGEKNDLVLQLKTGIDPLQHRINTQKVQTEQMNKNAQAEQYQAMAALRKQEAEVTAKTASERTAFLPDYQALAEISEDIMKSGKVPMGLTSDEFDKHVQEMALKEAQRQGLGVWKFQEGFGKWSDIAGLNADLPGKGKNAAAAKGAHGSDHPTGLTALDYLKAREQAEGQAHKEQQLTTEGDIPGTKKSVHPQSIEWKNDRVKQILSAMGLPADLNEYQKQAAPKQTADGRFKFDASKAPWNPKPDAPPPVAAAATPGQPAGPGVPPEVAQASIDTDRKFVQNARGLTDDMKTAANFLLTESEKIMKQYPDPSKLPPDVRKKLEEYSKSLKTITSKASPPEPAAPQQGVWVPQNDGQTDFSRGLRRVGAGARRLLEGYNPQGGGGGGF